MDTNRHETEASFSGSAAICVNLCPFVVAEFFS